MDVRLPHRFFLYLARVNAVRRLEVLTVRIQSVRVCVAVVDVHDETAQRVVERLRRRDDEETAAFVNDRMKHDKVRDGLVRDHVHHRIVYLGELQLLAIYFHVGAHVPNDVYHVLHQVLTQYELV